MRPEEIRDLLQARLFRPFRVHLSNGTSHDIVNGQMAIVDRSALRIHLSVADRPVLSAGVFLVSLIHIVQIEIPATASNPSQN